MCDFWTQFCLCYLENYLTKLSFLLIWYCTIHAFNKANVFASAHTTTNCILNDSDSTLFEDGGPWHFMKNKFIYFIIILNRIF